MRVRRLGLSLVAFAAVGVGFIHRPPAADAQTLTITPTWTVPPLADNGNPIAMSSPNVATLAGGRAVVVGDRSGNLWAFNLANGQPVPGWPVRTGIAIDSTPSVVPVAGGTDDVYVGVGSSAEPNVPYGYRAYRSNGSPFWYANVAEPPTDGHPAGGVQASLTVADLQGQTDVVAGSLDQESYALDAADGKSLAGWPYFTADSVFSTAAVGDLYGNGQPDVVMGGASSPGFGIGQFFPTGGHMRILNSHGGLVCNYYTTQEVDSSPAVGPVLAGGATGIVVGTGGYWPGASDTNTLKAFNNDCGLVWSDRLDGVTSSSPALADVLGNNSLQVVEGTDRGQGANPGGSVWVINPGNGGVLWHETVTGRVIGSVVTADLTGLGYQDLLVPTTDGVDVIDGRSHQTVAVLATHYAFQNSPLVTEDPDGQIGITIAGYNGNNQGVLFHYEVPSTNAAAAVGGGAWPMFHHDPQLTGFVGTTAPEAGCAVPSASVAGYDTVASDGGVFSFGQPFCGSTGAIHLFKPIVGMAMTPGGGGYWLVASDGGIFTFGDARFYGSTGNVHLFKPIVRMAATPDGRGYWLVASDGGIFSFGDARFYGSTGNVHLFKPIVGMAATPDGRGYWLVASDGGIFTFGDAGFAGSTGGIHLAKPIVGMAYDAATGTYWLVASDGGVFSFGSQFYGSTGGIHLNKPIVGMAATADGRGYWLVASDGGVFSFGDARFFGSTGNIRLNRPMVGLAGFLG